MVREGIIPASRPTTESFSQFDPEAFTRYLKPIALEVSTRPAICGRARFSNRSPVTHADRLVSNGPPPHPITTTSKLGPWSVISLIVPLATVEVVGDPGSDLSSKAPTLMRQNRSSRLSRCPYKLEREARKQDKYVRSVGFDSLTDGYGENIVWRLVRAGCRNCRREVVKVGDGRAEGSTGKGCRNKVNRGGEGYIL